MVRWFVTNIADAVARCYEAQSYPHWGSRARGGVLACPDKTQRPVGATLTRGRENQKEPRVARTTLGSSY